MNEHFLTYEQSLSVKELAFNESSFAWYLNDLFIDKFPIDILDKLKNDGISFKLIRCPLKSQFFKWVRETHKINSMIDFRQTQKNYGYVFSDEHGNETEAYDLDGKSFHSYEDAEDACINKIIELLKQKQ